MPKSLAEAEQLGLDGRQKGLIFVQRYLAQPLLNSLLLVLLALLGGLSPEEVRSLGAFGRLAAAWHCLLAASLSQSSFPGPLMLRINGVVHRLLLTG